MIIHATCWIRVSTVVLDTAYHRIWIPLREATNSGSPLFRAFGGVSGTQAHGTLRMLPYVVREYQINTMLPLREYLWPMLALCLGSLIIFHCSKQWLSSKAEMNRQEGNWTRGLRSGSPSCTGDYLYLDYLDVVEK